MIQDRKKQKPFLDYREQIDRLSERGCQIEDEAHCLSILRTVGYYRLTGYLLPFRLPNSEKYQDGTSITKVYQIYEFDRKLRNLLLQSLEVIEVSLRASLAHFHAATERYGPIGYYEKESFNTKHNHERFRESVNREIQHQQGSLIVQHYQKDYNGIFPLWVAMGFFTFGMLAFFYDDLKTADKKKFLREYYPSIHYRVMGSWLRCCTDLRNLCAHYNRLYFRQFTAIPKRVTPQKGEQRSLWEEREQRSLWPLICVMKELYPNEKEWEQEFANKLKSLFDEYRSSVKLSQLGFPEDWEARIKSMHSL